MSGEQKSTSEGLDSALTKKLASGLFFLNIYFIFRFLITFLNRYQTINTLSKLFLIALILICSAGAYFLLRQKYNLVILEYLSKTRVIYEVFILFLISSQILNWLTEYLTTSVAFELRAWFISNYFLIVVYLGLIWLFPYLNKNSFRIQDNQLKKPYLIGFFVISSIIIGYWVYTQVISPLPLYNNYDPEFSYMFTSTAPYKEVSLYSRMDHPGTFLQIIGTLITGLISPLTILQSGYPIFINITQPGIFIFSARLIVLILTLAAFYILLKISADTFQVEGIYAGLGIPIIYFSSHYLSLKFTTIWSPNSFNFALGSLLLAYLLRTLSTDQVEPKKLAFISLAAGLIGTFQVYMITWGIGVSAAIFFYFLFTTRKTSQALSQGLKSIFLFGMGYLIGLLVIIDQIGSFLEWLFKIVFHQGLYGDGPQGVLSIEQAKLNFQAFLGANPVIIVAASILIISLLVMITSSWKKVLSSPGTVAAVIGITIQALVLSALVLKHPRDRYLLSIAALLPVLLMAFFILLRMISNPPRYIYPVVFVVLFSGFCYSVSINLRDHLVESRYFNSYQAEVQRFISEYAADQHLNESEINKYWLYGSFSQCYALWFGNDYTRGLFTKEITEQCSSRRDFAVDIWSKRLSPVSKDLSLENLDSNSVIIGESWRFNQLGLADYWEVSSPKVENLSFFIRNPDGQDTIKP